MQNTFLGFLVSLSSCMGLEKAEKERIRQQNLKGEYIYRYENEVLFVIPPPKRKQKELYPWEKSVRNDFLQDEKSIVTS